MNNKPNDIERTISELFVRLGYKVEHQTRIHGIGVDFVVESRDGVLSPVELKASKEPMDRQVVAMEIHRLMPALTYSKYSSPILISIGGFTPAAKEFLKENPVFRYWDAYSLLEKARDFSDIYRKIKDSIDTNSIVKTEYLPNSTKQEGIYLIEELEKHIDENRISPIEYERLCMKVFAHVFDPDLYGFKQQSRTSDGANRYDFICRIRPGNQFWDTLRSDFKTKAILFECKNYNERITADQVYSTERYLFSGALRTVCFLVSRLGPDDGCKKAAQGAMREASKLILLLSNSDLIELIKLTSEPGGAENYLDERIWEFIVSLPR